MKKASKKDKKIKAPAIPGEARMVEPDVVIALPASLENYAKFSSSGAAMTPQEAAQLPTVTAQQVETTSDESEKSESAKDEKPKEKVRKLQKWKDISFIRKLIIIFGGLITIYGLIPMVYGLFTVGTIPIVCIGLFFVFTALYWNVIIAPKHWFFNALITIAAVIISAGVILMSYISGIMLAASFKSVPENQTRVTVVVLGCKVKGDQPTNMLRDRLDVAAQYLLSNPEAYCIVTGGQGDDEIYSEAYVMRKYLVDKGISEMRILTEEQSTSTLENLQYSAELIDRYNCYEDVVIVSDRFHQYRAQQAAELSGIDRYYSLCSETRWYMAGHYWFREMAGICRIYLLGYD